jgi:pyruvate/2-oxoglutarate dehydrogenase complex dihydrolipoamide acyltransferase (E2) component
VSKIHVKQGMEVSVGQLLISIDTGSDGDCPSTAKSALI